jgi:serine phosphatase RsbU (regulator of sigma subunit)/ligand-binding sensor domain-containing protein
MIKRIFSLVLILSSFLQIDAQQGSLMLSNFNPLRNLENQSWAICQDDNLVMFFANRKGILTFDGDDYQTIKIPAIPYSIQQDPKEGRIYVGGDNTFGYLEKNITGGYNYISLPGDSLPSGVITKILFDGPSAWFYGDQTIIRYNLDTRKQDLRLDSKPGSPFSGMMVTPKNTFINVSGTGLFRLESDTLFPIVTGYLTEKTEILFSLPYNANLVLVGLSDGSLSLFDGIKYNSYQVKDNGYLKANILSEGIALGDTAYAFSTLDGGAEVVEKKSGKVYYYINNQNELPDDEVFAIGSDRSGGLWLSHQYGLTRADLNLPVRNYSIFPGLKGNLSSTLRYNNELYVSTSEGVFYLTEVKNYTGVDVIVKIKPQSVPEVADTVNNQTTIQQNNRKNIFARIFGKKAARQELEKEKETENNKVGQVIRTRVNRLTSVSTSWVKIVGLNEKCRQLVATPYGILAATNKGLFIISNHKVSTITANRYINSVSWIPFGGKYFVAAADGYFAIKYQNSKWLTETPDPEFVSPVYSVFLDGNKSIWLGCDNMACRTDLDESQGKIKYYTYVNKNDFPERYTLDLVNDTIFLFTETGIRFYDVQADRFKLYTRRSYGTNYDADFYLPSSNHWLYRVTGDWYSINQGYIKSVKELSLLKIFDDIVSVNVEDKNLWVIAGNNKLYCIDRLESSKMNPGTEVFIKSISNDKGTAFNLGDVKFERGDNVINFNIIAPEYVKQNTTEYQYTINKIMSGWSVWNINTHYSKIIPRQGEYVLKVRAKDLWGNISESQSVKFIIRAPFTRTFVFYILAGFATLLLIGLVFRFREKQLHNQNRILENKVKERTAEIETQKEEITASIEYASRIQMAMLPVVDHFSKSFSDYFIFFKPRDIVSGDFYWIAENDRSIFFTVADCTGHGVPGAFMSTMGISTLNEIISNNRNMKANSVLNILRSKIMGALHQTGKEGEAADGMDIALCVMNKDKTILEYSGAYNSLFIFQGGELKEYKANRMPIGIHYGEEVSFTNYEINISKGDTIYLSSDGFSDQFGGPEGAKYKKSNLKRLLSEIYYRPMVEQRNIIETEFANWKGSGDQIDDITIIGVRI